LPGICGHADCAITDVGNSEKAKKQAKRFACGSLITDLAWNILEPPLALAARPSAARGTML
jgi:hypothetical protein